MLDNLHDRLADAYDSGYRRIILNLPAGTVKGQDFASSRWWPMPQWKREGIACLILNWLGDHADTQFEVYAGFPIDDPNSLCMSASNSYTVPTIEAGTCGNMSTEGYVYYPCAGVATAQSPSPFAQADVCDFHQNIQPWQYLGITRYWLDGSTAHWSDFVELPYCPLYKPSTGQPHFLGAEAFPMIFNSPDPDEIDLDRAVLCPAIMFPAHIAGEDGDKSWDVSSYAESTELMMIVDYTDQEYFALNSMFDVLAWTQRGFVLAAQATEDAFVPAQFIEFMKRVYDFGTLANRRDFNGDGTIDSQDATDFSAAYALYHGKSNCNWVHGDMDGDHDVDSHDSLLFNLWHNALGNPPPVVSVNLGSVNPYNALTKP